MDDLRHLKSGFTEYELLVRRACRTRLRVHVLDTVEGYFLHYHGKFDCYKLTPASNALKDVFAEALKLVQGDSYIRLK